MIRNLRIFRSFLSETDIIFPYLVTIKTIKVLLLSVVLNQQYLISSIFLRQFLVFYSSNITLTLSHTPQSI